MFYFISNYTYCKCINKYLTLKDTAIAITDLHEYLYYEPGKKLNHRVKAGDIVKEGTLASRAMV
ncbi:MAG: hypothetical protein KMY55_03490 [Dethiosulfatibacter sp.]|nr:hypothetical protein [Dethiosulfatibacter sp.]